jgi:predicted DNA-binding protein with PD1-like motif
MANVRILGSLIVGIFAAAALSRGHAQQAEQPVPSKLSRPVPTGMAPKMQVHETATGTHVFQVNFSTGDEIVSGLTDLAIKHHITSGYVTGLGGLSSALLVFNGAQEIPVNDKSELVSLTGDIQMRDGKPYVHLHAVLSLIDGSTRGGHVLEAHVAPVGEVAVVATAMGHEH